MQLGKLYTLKQDIPFDELNYVLLAGTLLRLVEHTVFDDAQIRSLDFVSEMGERLTVWNPEAFKAPCDSFETYVQGYF
jgi:hypothetical protein